MLIWILACSKPPLMDKTNHDSRDELQIALTHRAIAECNLELGDFIEAIKHTSQYLKISKAINNKLEQQRAYVTIGRCFQCRSDSASNGEVSRKSLLAAQQAILNSIKLTNQLTSLTSAQQGEMKAVSLLNLGHALCSMGDFESAASRFDQCIDIARKHALRSILFRAVFQNCEIPLHHWPVIAQSRLRHSDLLNHEESSNIARAISLCSQTLKPVGSQHCLSKETKALRRNLEELLAQLYVAKGSYRTAAKVYRQIARADSSSGLNYKELCGKVLRLDKIIGRFQYSDCESVDGTLQVSKIYEKMGDILSTMDLHSPAFRCYQQMLLWSEVAFTKQQSFATDSDSKCDLEALAKQVDSGMVSSAEACASFGAYALCAHFYRREILFNMSLSKYSLSNLNPEDLAQSWLSVAKALIQAPKNMPSDFVPPTCETLEGSYSPESALKRALSLIASRRNSNVARNVLYELIEYYKSCGKESKANEYSTELENMSDGNESSDSASDPILSRGKESEIDTNLDTQNDVMDEAIEVLSSDSEVEQCVNINDAATDLVESPGKRRTKALCLKTNLKGESPLHVASINGNLEHVVKLIEVVTHPINVRDGAGWLPIHEAAFHDHADIATYLLDKGASLDDTGCPEDHSTPLFEAIHGNALKTAIILINRGANLWHVNAEGETLSDLLNSWEPKKNAYGGTVAQRALFHQLMNAVRNKLGDSYDDWCSYHPPKPKIRTPTHSVAIVNDESDNEKENEETPTVSRRENKSRRLRSFSSSEHDKEQENRKENARRWNNSKPSRRDRRFDSPPPSPSQSKSKKKVAVTSVIQDSSVVNDYRNAMKAVGGSGTCHPTSSVIKRPSSVLNGVPVDADDEWLEDDIGQALAEKQLLKKRARSDLHPACSQNLSKLRRVGAYSADTSSHLSLDTMEFDPNEAICSTQVDALVMPSQTAADVPGPSTSFQQTNSHLEASQPTQLPSSSVGVTWCTVKVTFSDLSLLLPVDSQFRTVKWLAEEAYRRHQLLLEEDSVIPFGTQIRIRTSDGALLLPTDLLCTVLPQSTSPTPELMAEIVQKSKPTPPPSHLFAPSDSRSQFPATNVSKVNYPALKANLNHLPPHIRQSIISAVETGFLNLSFKALEAEGCASALTDYLKVRSESRPLTKLNLDGNLLSLKSNSSTSSSALFSVFSKLLTPNLKELSLASNILTLDDVLALLTSGRNESNHLTHLCLDHNPLFVQSTNSDGSPTTWLTGLDTPGFGFGSSSSPKLSRLLTICPNLTSLKLVNCGITPSIWEISTMSVGGNTDTMFLSHSPDSEQPVFTFAQLTELDLSLNPLSSEILSTDDDFLLDLLISPSVKRNRPNFSSLRTLCLRRSVALGEGKTGNTLAESWFLREDYSVQLAERPSGDAFIGCLARFLDSGKCTIQTLDISDCNLTEGCLTNFQRLLAAPSTTLTTLRCDGNPRLKNPTVWAKLISTSAQATSALTAITIDAPLVETEEDLNFALEAISRKMSHNICATPLWELTLITSDCYTWLGDQLLPLGKRVALLSSQLASVLQKRKSDASLSSRLLTHIASCFAQRFGKLSNVCRLNHGVVFSRQMSAALICRDLPLHST
nr:tonsoku protein [Hymenolepis microstoma]